MKKGRKYQTKWCARWDVLCGQEKYTESVGGGQNEMEK